MSTTQTREEWLTSLKVGDQVKVGQYGSPGGRRTIRTIIRITSTGQIVLDNKQRFSKDGFEMPSGMFRDYLYQH